MNILLIDTSKPEALVALVQDGQLLTKKSWTGDRTLGTKLLLAIEEMLKENSMTFKDLNRIAAHGGPGHYSALRSGVVTGNMLAMGLEIELVQLKGKTIEEMIHEATTSVPVQTIMPSYI